MKITAIKSYVVGSRMSPDGWTRSKPFVFVKVETDEGLIGWGEAYALNFQESSIALLVEEREVRPASVGNVEKLTEAGTGIGFEETLTFIWIKCQSRIHPLHLHAGDHREEFVGFIDLNDLLQLDANGDGQLTGAELNGLELWADDGDAVVEAGEMVSAAAAGVTRISTQMGLEQNAKGEDLMRSAATVAGEEMMTEDVWFGKET